MSKKKIDLTPDWHVFFDLAIGIARDEIDEDKGREVVVEMLEYGQRLNGVTADAEDQRQRRLAARIDQENWSTPKS